MGTAQVTFTAEELLASHDYAEPLFANGIACHGGFDEDGTYVSPRTRFRGPAIEAWEAKRVEDFGTDPLHIPIDAWPRSFPNVEQTKFLVRHGITEPTIAALTRIGTVEGFGAMMRFLPLPDFQTLFVESIEGTATEHIPKGLFEAHARDEAGWEAEAGHNTMWFAARDIAFENPVTEDMTQQMLTRMGIIPPSGGAPDMNKIRQMMEANRVLPSDIPLEFEGVLGRMIGLLFIELSAFHGFTWAEGVLSDTDLFAGEGEAARIVSYIRADETPHVGYLGVALSEMRDRTWKGTTGATYDGDEMIQLLWDRALADSMFLRRGEILRMTMNEIERAIGDRPDRDDLLEEFFTLGTVRRLDDGTLVEVQADGREVRVALDGTLA
ncbi:MAG: hypothetical protein R2699_13135 [Acidimicrobiales bacterium]|nr:hypothetical protein [Acidimicrobiales bacterium]